MINITIENNEGRIWDYLANSIESTHDGYMIEHPGTGQLLSTVLEDKKGWIKKVKSRPEKPIYYSVVVDMTCEHLADVMNIQEFMEFSNRYAEEHEIQLLPIGTVEDSIILVERVRFSSGTYYNIDED